MENVGVQAEADEDTLVSHATIELSDNTVVVVVAESDVVLLMVLIELSTLR